MRPHVSPESGRKAGGLAMAVTGEGQAFKSRCSGPEDEQGEEKVLVE